MTEVMDKERIDISQFEIDVKNNPNTRSNMVVIGLGATGSSFMLLLAHFLKFNSNHDIHLYDFDYIDNHNYQVSLYGFANKFGIGIDRHSKAISSHRILSHLIGDGRSMTALNNTINHYAERVTCDLLEAKFGEDRFLDYIMVFTDSNKSRAEVAEYHENHPDTVIFDIRVGSYDQFEVFYSRNPTKYAKTIYYDDDGSLRDVENEHRVCLDERMHFSIAMTGASMLMNLFTMYTRDALNDTDFKHVMFGRDYIGEVKGYE